MAFAKGTEVAVDKTETEIKATLRRYGATSFASYETQGKAMVAFEMHDRRIVFKLPLPSIVDFAYAMMGARGRVARTKEAQRKAWDQACRERWRALLLCIKAKLESVESGIETFEDAFLAHIQLPGGGTVGEEIRPAIAQRYATNSLTPLLPGPK